MTVVLLSIWIPFISFYSLISVVAAAAAATKSLQSCPTLFDPTDGSPPGSPVPGILQARTLEWVAISFSNAWSENSKWSHSVMSDSVQPHRWQPTRLLHPWDFPDKSTGVGCHCLLWFLWLVLPKLCWVIVARVGALVLFLIIEEMLSVFHHED